MATLKPLARSTLAARDRLAAELREYAQLSRRIVPALRPMVLASLDEASVSALRVIERRSTALAETTADAMDGAVEHIGESRAAWTVLRDARHPCANGLPAAMIRRLTQIDRLASSGAQTRASWYD